MKFRWTLTYKHCSATRNNEPIEGKIESEWSVWLKVQQLRDPGEMPVTDVMGRATRRKIEIIPLRDEPVGGTDEEILFPRPDGEGVVLDTDSITLVLTLDEDRKFVKDATLKVENNIPHVLAKAGPSDNLLIPPGKPDTFALARVEAFVSIDPHPRRAKKLKRFNLEDPEDKLAETIKASLFEIPF